MSAITGIGDSATIVRSASASCSRGTAQRTTSAPASATLRIWSIVAVRFAVSVLVIVCTTTGAPPPIGTLPTKICRLEAISEGYPGRPPGLVTGPVAGRERLFGDVEAFAGDRPMSLETPITISIRTRAKPMIVARSITRIETGLPRRSFSTIAQKI